MKPFLGLPLLAAAFPARAATQGMETTAPDAVALGTLPHDLTVLGMYQAADWVVKAVMLGLVLASVITWTVWLVKTLELFRLRRQLQADQQQLHSGDADAEAGCSAPAVQRLLACIAHERALSGDNTDADGLKERLVSTLAREEGRAARQMAIGTGVLATIGATAPFVGLFGTVWGIMNAFIGIAHTQTTNLAVVAPGIAEALLATALGLVAAIPAVVIYNHFSRVITGVRAQLGDISALLLRNVSRQISSESQLHQASGSR